MRIRTLLTLATGAAAGAGAMYLLDPEHGEARRREARRTAVAEARRRGTAAFVEGRQRAEEVATAAWAGYREARATPGDRAPAQPMRMGN